MQSIPIDLSKTYPDEIGMLSRIDTRGFLYDSCGPGVQFAPRRADALPPLLLLDRYLSHHLRWYTHIVNYRFYCDSQYPPTQSISFSKRIHSVDKRKTHWATGFTDAKLSGTMRNREMSEESYLTMLFKPLTLILFIIPHRAIITPSELPVSDRDDTIGVENLPSVFCHTKVYIFRRTDSEEFETRINFTTFCVCRCHRIQTYGSMIVYSKLLYTVKKVL